MWFYKLSSPSPFLFVSRYWLALGGFCLQNDDYSLFGFSIPSSLAELSVMRTKIIPICVTKQSSKVLLDVGAYGSLRRTSVLWIGQIIVLYLIGHVVGLWTS